MVIYSVGISNRPIILKCVYLFKNHSGMMGVCGRALNNSVMSGYFTASI